MNGPVVIILAFAASLVLTFVLVSVDLYLDDWRENRRRRAMARSFPEAARYARARDAVARAQKPYTVRLGHDNTRENNE